MANRLRRSLTIAGVSLAVVSVISLGDAQTRNVRKPTRLQRQVEYLSLKSFLDGLDSRRRKEKYLEGVHPTVAAKQQRMQELSRQLVEDRKKLIPHTVEEEIQLETYVATLLVRISELERRIERLEYPEPRIELLEDGSSAIRDTNTRRPPSR